MRGEVSSREGSTVKGKGEAKVKGTVVKTSQERTQRPATGWGASVWWWSRLCGLVPHPKLTVWGANFFGGIDISLTLTHAGVQQRVLQAAEYR